MEPLAFGDLGHSVFSDDKLDEIVNKMKEEPVIPLPAEAVTAKENDTPEKLELAGKIVGMAEPGILVAEPEKPKLNPDEFERRKPEIAKRLEIISNEDTDVAARRTVRDELRENFGLDIGDEFLEEDERGRILREEMLRGASLYLSSGGEELGTWGANENGVKIFLQDMGYQFKPGEEPELVTADGVAGAEPEVETLAPERREVVDSPIEALIKTYESHFNERFLRSREDATEADNISDGIDAKNVLEVSGFGGLSLENATAMRIWQTRIAAGGPDATLALNEMFVAAQKIYLDHIMAKGVLVSFAEKAKNIGLEVIISTHTHQEVLRAQKLGADAVTYSPIFASPNKGAPKGIDALKELLEVCDISVFALGGIVDKSHVDMIEQTKAYGFASIRYFY